MDLLKTVAIFFAAAIGELGGTYAVWRWRRTGAAAPVALLGVMLLVGYALVQTYQPEARYGRVYAAYAGVFLVGARCSGDGASTEYGRTVSISSAA